MLANVLTFEDHGSDDEHSGSEDEKRVVVGRKSLPERGGMLKKKVLAVTKLLRVYKTHRYAGRFSLERYANSQIP